jgi:hypothetical protein
LLTSACSKSPTGKHQPYQGTSRKFYVCTYCATFFSIIYTSFSNSCSFSSINCPIRPLMSTKAAFR